MSHPSVMAARVQMGGEEKQLSFESFPYTASSKTYCVDKQVADSGKNNNKIFHRNFLKVYFVKCSLHSKYLVTYGYTTAFLTF